MLLLDAEELDKRLTEWGSFARGLSLGSGGGSDGYMRERLDNGADSDEFTPEIQITERAVARTRLENRAYSSIIKRYYLGEEAIVEIASFYHTSEYGTKCLFEQAKNVVNGYICDLENGVDI